MKKTYNIPTLTVVNIQPACILNASERVGVGQEYTNSNTTLLGRRGSFTGSNEEEE